MATTKKRHDDIRTKKIDVSTELLIDYAPFEYAPARPSDSYAYGLKIDTDTFFIAGAAKKTYLAYLGGDRESGEVVTGDSNDALLRMSHNNYAACDSNFIMRGINISINQRSGGTMGRMEAGAFGSQNKSGGTVPTLVAMTVVPENYGTVATEFGGIDVVLKNENNTATTSYGIRIRNNDQSGVTAIQAALAVSSHASSSGFRELIDASGAVLAEYDSGTQVVLMKFQGADGTTYYLVHDTDAATVLAVATSVS